MPRAKVIRSYKSAYPNPLIINAGQNLRIEKRESEWPGWTWCLDNNGKAGWVPSAYLSINGLTAKALVEYNANELTVETGDELEFIKEESGWAWCQDRNNNLGWVPISCIEKIT